MRNRPRHRYYHPSLHCDHQEASYCDACWRAALARGLSAEEWAELHTFAAAKHFNGPGNTYKAIQPYRLPAAPKPAASWNGHAIATIGAAITKTTEPTIRERCASFAGLGDHGYQIAATDGSRLLAVPGQPTGSTRMAEYLDPAFYQWITLPADTEIALRRVQLCSPDTAYKPVTWTLGDWGLTLLATDHDGNSARQILPVDWTGPEIGITLASTYLLDVVRQGLQFGIRGALDPIMLRPADDRWRYVQMAMRS